MRKPVNVEICVGGEDEDAVRQAAACARVGGAARMELCRAMHLAGLTPSVPSIKAARAAWGAGGGLMIMVRPRPGDFCYSREEEDTLGAQIRLAAHAGADGVVLGVLRSGDGRVCRTTMRRLLRAAGEEGLAATFHRAFDATPDPAEALETLIDLGVPRVLTSGCAWGAGGTALDGVPMLRQTITQAGGRIEIILCGGITAVTLPELLAQLPSGSGPVSVHAYTGAQQDGVTDTTAVRTLVAAAAGSSPASDLDFDGQTR